MFVQSMDDNFKGMYIQLSPDGTTSKHAHYIKRPWKVDLDAKIG